MAKKPKNKLAPKRHHGYAVLLFILGTLFPPLAVAARFGMGGDFWLNLLLTICGYIPGHFHNFYIQNIRNNKNHARTPKWAQRYGLVDTASIKRRERRSQWASRYQERNPESTLADAPYAEGQEGGSSIDVSLEDGGRPQAARQTSDLWRPEDEAFYNADGGDSASSHGRWHYPANFDDAAQPRESRDGSKKKKKKDKKDRWARTDDAYSLSEEQPKKTKKKKKKSSTDGSLYSRDSVPEFPEAAEGGLYGDERRGGAPGASRANGSGDDIFTHQF